MLSNGITVPDFKTKLPFEKARSRSSHWVTERTLRARRKYFKWKRERTTLGEGGWGGGNSCVVFQVWYERPYSKHISLMKMSKLIKMRVDLETDHHHDGGNLSF